MNCSSPSDRRSHSYRDLSCFFFFFSNRIWETLPGLFLRAQTLFLFSDIMPRHSHKWCCVSCGAEDRLSWEWQRNYLTNIKLVMVKKIYICILCCICNSLFTWNLALAYISNHLYMPSIIIVLHLLVECWKS